MVPIPICQMQNFEGTAACNLKIEFIRLFSGISDFSRTYKLSENSDFWKSHQLSEISKFSRSRQLSENLENNDGSPFELNLSVGVAYLGGHFGSFGSAQNDSGIGQ